MPMRPRPRRGLGYQLEEGTGLQKNGEEEGSIEVARADADDERLENVHKAEAESRECENNDAEERREEREKKRQEKRRHRDVSAAAAVQVQVAGVRPVPAQMWQR